MAKRSAAGTGTIRKKTVTRNGKPYTFWEARYTAGYDPGTGKQLQRSISGKTQKEVAQKLKAATAAIDAGTYFEPSRILLSQWAEVWLAEYQGDKKYLTQKHYKAQVRTHILPALGAVKLASLSAPQIQAFYNGLLRDGLAAKSVRNIHGILTKCLATAVQVGLIRENPASRVTLPRVERKEIRPLTEQQVTDFLREVQGDSYACLLQMILFTGLREAEAIGLCWDCVDFQRGELKICKQLQKRPLSDGGFTFAPLKNDKSRVIKPAPFVMGLLEQRRREETAQRLRAGQLWQGWQSEAERATAPVFTSAVGTHLHPQTVYNHYKKIARAIGAPDSRVHDLRHTYAVLSLQNGDDVKTVQGNLGHATASFTLDIYGHVSDRMREDSSQRMEQYIGRILGR